MSGSIPALFQRLTQGVYVIGVGHGEAHNAFTAAWVMQVSFDPLLLVLSINPEHSSYKLLRESRAFSVNVLSTAQLDLAARYGQPASTGKWAPAEWTTGRTGVPVLSAALASFECRALDEHAAGDHRLVVAKVVGGELRDAAAEPLSYRATGALDGAAALFPPSFEES